MVGCCTQVNQNNSTHGGCSYIPGRRSSFYLDLPLLDEIKTLRTSFTRGDRKTCRIGNLRKSRDIENDQIEIGMMGGMWGSQGPGPQEAGTVLDLPSAVSSSSSLLSSGLSSFRCGDLFYLLTVSVVRDKVTRHREIKKCPEGIKNAYREAGV